MKKRTWLWALLAVILVSGGLIFAWQNKRQNTGQQGTKQEKASLNIQRKPAAKKNNAETDDYSNDEWMLMAYLTYARPNYQQSRHIQGTTALVKAVQDDLDDGALKADKISSAEYSLSNKFGSITIKVAQRAVKVSGDGSSTIKTKLALKHTFSPYAAEIRQMTKRIAASSKQHEHQVQKLPHYSIKQLAILAGFARGGEGWVKDCINKTAKMVSAGKQTDVLVGLMCYGYRSKDGYYYLDGHGDDTTQVNFQLQGDVLVTKHNDMTGPSVEQSPWITKTFSLRDLTAKYYATAQERQEVDNLAQKLLNQKEFDAEVTEK